MESIQNMVMTMISFISAYYDPVITFWHAINCGIIAILIGGSSLHHQQERMYRYSGILGYILAAASAWISLDILFGTYGGTTKTSDWAQVLVVTIIVILVRGDMDRLIYIARKLSGYYDRLRRK